jgi:lysozyme
VTTASDIVRAFEGCELAAYPDPYSPLGQECQARGLRLRDWRGATGATGAALQEAGKPWTIGWGNTGGVNPGDTISQQDADALLERRLASFQASVLELLLPLNLPDNQVAALTSFEYNEGEGSLKTSALLRRIRTGEASLATSIGDTNNAWDFAGPAAEFAKWDRAGGRVSRGLDRRRLAEALVFCGVPTWKEDSQ